MDEKLFNELLDGVKEMAAIRAGKRKPARRTVLGKKEIVAVREDLKLTQDEFARAFGVSVSTLRNWEQGRRRPTGAAFTLLNVAKRHPKAILDTMRELTAC